MIDFFYCGQILVFIQFLIGNYGVFLNECDEFGFFKYFEFFYIQCVGVVVVDVVEKYSYWIVVESLGEWCVCEGVFVIFGVDICVIVIYFCEQGFFFVRIIIGDEYDVDEDEGFIDFGQINFVKCVSIKVFFVVVNFNVEFYVVFIDCGVKENIFCSLVSCGVFVIVFFYDYFIYKVVDNFDGIFIFNGFGDLIYCQEIVYNFVCLMEIFFVFIMGICFGYQFLVFVVGVQIIKFKYGNCVYNILVFDLIIG